MKSVIEKLHTACKHNYVQQVRDILESYTMDELNSFEKNENITALVIASQRGYFEIVQLLLEHGDSMVNRNHHGLTPFSQARNEQTRQIFVRYQRPLPRFAGDLIEWTKAYREPAIKRAQIREYLARDQFIFKPFKSISGRYIRCYLALDGFSSIDIDKLEKFEYTSVDGFIRAYTSASPFHKYVNQHLATYALNFFNSSFDPLIPYSFIFCLLSIVATILHNIRSQPSFIGRVYRGMLIAQKDLDKYIVGSRILNTAFFSTSEDRIVAEIFGGIHSDDSSFQQDSSHIKVICMYKIRNPRTAYDIQKLSLIDSEKEILIFPFAAFYVTRVQRIAPDVMEIDLNECNIEIWQEDDFY